MLWLTTEEAAELLGISERVARRNAVNGKYGDIRYEDGIGGGGKRIKIDLKGLPEHLQAAWVRDYGFGEIMVDEDDLEEWEQAPDWQREIAGERLEIIQNWDRYVADHADRPKTEVTKEYVRLQQVVNEENKFSVSTLYRWKKAYREGGKCGLLPGWGTTNRPTQRQMNRDMLALFEKMYLTQQQRTVADCYQDLVLVAKHEGWNRIPALRTFQRVVDEDIPYNVKILLREGEEAWWNKCAPNIFRDPGTVAAGEMWVGDHQTMDLLVVGKNGKPVRPTLTAWLDFRSWMLVGWMISYQGNTDTIMASFAKAARDREIGLPRHILIDNGQDYASYGFAGRGRRKKSDKVDETKIRTLVADLNITPHFTIPAKPKSKTIERFFRIVSEKFSKRFETYTGSNEQERPADLDRMIKENPDIVPQLTDVSELFGEWVTHVYHKLPSQGKGREGENPEQTWQRHRGPVRLVPKKALRIALMRRERPQKVQRDGVRVWGEWYYNPELVNHLGEEVVVRYDDEDMSRVQIFDIEGRHLCEAELEAPVPAIDVDKEVMREKRRKQKRAKRVTEEAAAIKEQTDLEPNDLARTIELTKQQNGPDKKEEPKVIEPVRIDQHLRDAGEKVARLDQARAAGGENDPSPDIGEAMRQMLFEEPPKPDKDKRKQMFEALSKLHDD